MGASWWYKNKTHQMISILMPLVHESYYYLLISSCCCLLHAFKTGFLFNVVLLSSYQKRCQSHIQL